MLTVLTKTRLVENVKFKGSLACCDHEVVEFKTLWQQGGHTASSIPFRRAGLFRDLFDIIPWDTALERRRAQEIWLILKDRILQTQE